MFSRKAPRDRLAVSAPKELEMARSGRCAVPPATSDLVKGSRFTGGQTEEQRVWKCFPGFSVSGLRRVSVL